MMLLVGVVTAGVALGRDNSIQNAAREASRFAATYVGPIDNDWLRSVVSVAEGAALGDLDPSVPGHQVCVAVTDGAGAYVEVGLTDTGGSEDFTTTSCLANDGRPDGEVRVQVTTRRTSAINAILFSSDVNLAAEAAARYERNTS